ncbi:hypothetical protein E6W39_14535 [Kitasatospora acidiphila]|uniref:Uncharacterized protein n=1 Tax=Kitasatospora acidiphila TaxID=2567942 RepID=A0A540W2I6_9ACTN|nr:hypothetical protein [Kitasatospora acidiphila]TQF03238.1 hypothetical protein E6W39_14535 [Kitasatospora acidiphila]
MRALAYEGRRLLGIRSTWLILAAALLTQAAATALLAHRAGPADLRMPQLVRTVTATLPLLPLPLAGLAAGLLGALAADHEVRQPGLAASQVRFLVRMRLLLAKLGLVGAVAAVLAAVSLLVDAVAVRLIRPSTAHLLNFGEVASLGHLRADRWPLSMLLAFTAVVVAAGWLGSWPQRCPAVRWSASCCSAHCPCWSRSWPTCRCSTGCARPGCPWWPSWPTPPERLGCRGPSRRRCR